LPFLRLSDDKSDLASAAINHFFLKLAESVVLDSVHIDKNDIDHLLALKNVLQILNPKKVVISL
jgi:hypothetical protein